MYLVQCGWESDLEGDLNPRMIYTAIPPDCRWDNLPPAVQADMRLAESLASADIRHLIDPDVPIGKQVV